MCDVTVDRGAIRGNNHSSARRHCCHESLPRRRKVLLDSTDIGHDRCRKCTVDYQDRPFDPHKGLCRYLFFLLEDAFELPPAGNEVTV
jgi:hypothetical protein